MTDLKESLKLLGTLISGYKTFQSTGKAPFEAWLAMRKLFVVTNGWSNDIFQFFYGLRHPCGPIPDLGTSIIKGVDETGLRQATEHLRTDGYYVFPQRIESQILDEL